MIDLDLASGDSEKREGASGIVMGDSLSKRVKVQVKLLYALIKTYWEVGESEGDGAGGK